VVVSEIARLSGAARGIVFGVEIEHHALSAKLVERNSFAMLV
jgi:hypothetical protein